MKSCRSHVPDEIEVCGTDAQIAWRIGLGNDMFGAEASEPRFLHLCFWERFVKEAECFHHRHAHMPLLKIIKYTHGCVI
jgi:hypothetical protein